jgi:drug/metabolite transporter (DMT)-like permease
MKNFALLHVSFLLYSLVTVFAKTAAMSGWATPTFFLFAAFEIMTLAVYAVLWQQVLRKFTLMVAYANKGIVIIWNLIWAVVLFRESVTLENVIGGAIVIAGMILVSTDEN